MVKTNSAKSTNCVFVQINGCEICSGWLPRKCITRYAVPLRVLATTGKSIRVDNYDNKNTNDNNDDDNNTK